jgi:hypothetical protein
MLRTLHVILSIFLIDLLYKDGNKFNSELCQNYIEMVKNWDNHF